ncbi:MAG: response regulator transcription factor [Dehalococcoidia bacterium]
MTTRILVVDDEPTVGEVVERYLGLEGYEVSRATDGENAVLRWRDWDPNLIVLDLMLPGIDGLEVCRSIRSESQVPIIMLTAKGEEADRIVGLELGADDYMVKPFSPRELVARVKSVLRRSNSAPSLQGERLSLGDLTISPVTRAVMRGSTTINLTGKEFDLLHFLAAHQGQVFTREQLMDQVWDYTFAGDFSTVTVHVRRLREKVEVNPAKPRHIKTVWGVGYKFEK